METFNHIFHSIIPHNDQHGVIDLLEQVSRSASCCSEEQRQEVREIARRLRQKHIQMTMKGVVEKTKGFGMEALHAEELLRGLEYFGIVGGTEAAPTPPQAAMLRDFAHPKYNADDEDDSDHFSEGNESGDHSLDESGYVEGRFL
eukprot:scaffold11675_cov123-Cylindrotheca_fusiformis.AAC.7